jgi:hypothetical protein
MALRSLVLLNAVNEYLKAAVDAAVIEIKTKPADFERLANPFMLAGVDAGVERLQ